MDLCEWLNVVEDKMLNDKCLCELCGRDMSEDDYLYIIAEEALEMCGKCYKEKFCT